MNECELLAVRWERGQPRCCFFETTDGNKIIFDDTPLFWNQVLCTPGSFMQEFVKPGTRTFMTYKCDEQQYNKIIEVRFSHESKN